MGGATMLESARTCKVCGLEKPITAFPLRGRSKTTSEQWRSHTCRSCGGKRWQARAACNIAGCARRAVARELCHMHYRRWRDGRPLVPGVVHPRDGEDRERRPVCVAAACSRPAPGGSDYCNAHTQRVRKHGDPREAEPLLERGLGRYVDSDGYVVVRANGHPNGSKNGAIFEHVEVMSAKIGRPLRPLETVHHKNGVRDDNRPENLELWIGAHPRGARVSDHIAWALQVIETYGDDPEAWMS